MARTNPETVADIEKLLFKAELRKLPILKQEMVNRVQVKVNNILVTVNKKTVMYTKDFIVGALAKPYCTYFLQHVSQEQGVLDEVWNKLFMGVFGTLAHGAENRSVCGIHKTVVHELYEYVVR